MIIMKQYNLELKKIDIKIAFLHKNLEAIYMEQLEDLLEEKFKVCLLKKYLYVLKQIPWQQYNLFDKFLLNNGFVRSGNERYVCILKGMSKLFISTFIFDDILVASYSTKQIKKLNEILNEEFVMKDIVML